MKNGFLKKLLPHVAALAVFLIIALLYCKPALEGKVLNQSDITNWKGAVNQSLEFAKTHDGKGPCGPIVCLAVCLLFKLAVFHTTTHCLGMYLK
jgi:hypothetical protein